MVNEIGCKKPSLGLAIGAVSLVLVAGCQSSSPQTIGSLAKSPRPEVAEEPVTEASHRDVRDEYTELLDIVEDEHLKEQIERRVADVYMMEGVQDQNQSAGSSHYVEAIKAYRNILEKYPNSPDNAEVLYQLAKAYDMEGDLAQAQEMLTDLVRRHPYYAHIAEAHFRLGDLHFNQQNYKEAEAAYQAVLTQNKPSLATNARYMLGWSYYKQAKFTKGLDEFALVLDGLLSTHADLEQLSKAERPLAEDTIHSITLSLDKLGGAQSIATLPAVADRHYVWLLYQALGDYYLDKELYEKSASAYRIFVTRHPDSPQSPLLHSKIIDTYVTGGFPSLALDEKEAYVAAYGINSGYAGNRGGMPPHVATSLATYLDELARYYYNSGKTAQQQADEAEVTNSEDEQLAINAYSQAADYYSQFAATFPEDERIDEVYFLMSESLFLAKRYDQAISGYERVAYQPHGTSAKNHAANAGYAAIVSYQEHIKTLKTADPSAKTWQSSAVESMLRFANTYHDDQRAVAVLTNAAEYLFGLNHYQRALEVASDLIAHNATLESNLKKTAYGIIAHSYFNLADYPNAEVNYLEQRNLVEADSPEYNQISERIATAIYKNAEQIGARGEDSRTSESMANELLKLKSLTPDSKLRVPAQYEAATILLNLELWDRAIAELKELAEIYPDHELAVDFPRRLAFAYEKNEQWDHAAARYLTLSEQDPDAETRREALFLAATMYENGGNTEAAIEHYRKYANSFLEPTDMLMEARYKLAVNYQRIADYDKQLFWLDKIVEGADEFPATDRTRWLAAWANNVYGDHHATEFSSFALYLPLKESLARKTELFRSASQRYQMAAEQGVLEFATMSSFKIAEMYHELANALRSAPQPNSLTEDERPIYQSILEEQAAPFDASAMELHQANIDRAWSGDFDEWIDRSFAAMRALNPARFNKSEIIVSYGDEIR